MPPQEKRSSLGLLPPRSVALVGLFVIEVEHLHAFVGRHELVVFREERERAWIGAVHEKLAIEVIAFVLSHGGERSIEGIDLRLPLAIEGLDDDRCRAHDAPAQARHRQATLEHGHAMRRVCDTDVRIDPDAQRERLHGGVAWIFFDLGDAETDRMADLRRREPSAIDRAHRIDHVVDERLRSGRAQLVQSERPRDLAQQGVAEVEDVELHGTMPVREERRGGACTWQSILESQ